MQNRRITIIAVSAVCVAVCAIIILVLLLTMSNPNDTSTSTTEESSKTAITSVSDDAYLFLCANGTFNFRDALQEGYDFAEEFYHHEWRSDHEYIHLCRSYLRFNFQEEAEPSYTFDGRDAYAVDMTAPPADDSYEECKEYTIFLEWCEEIGFTPEELIAALDRYAASL